jgi:hypothetical protein
MQTLDKSKMKVMSFTDIIEQNGGKVLSTPDGEGGDNIYHMTTFTKEDVETWRRIDNPKT